jgi:DNA-binding transcriptional LysR family regulator
VYIEIFQTFDSLWLSNLRIKMSTETPAPAQLLNRLRMRQVALMLVIEELGTLHAASLALGMTQPAATKMLHELERALGQTLFDRVGRGLQVNDAGRCVLAHFHGMQGTITALSRELKALQQGSGGKLFVGSIMAASPAFLTPALIQLKQKYPLLAVEITVETSDRLLELLQEGALDLVIGRVTSDAADDYIFSPIAQEPLSVVVAKGHPLAGKSRVRFAALLDYPWVLQSRGSPMREVVEQEFKSNQASLPKGLIETSSILTTTNLISQTPMVAVIPQSVAVRYQQHGLLDIVPYTLRHELEAFGSILRRDRPPNQSTAALLELLNTQVAQMGD